MELKLSLEVIYLPPATIDHHWRSPEQIWRSDYQSRARARRVRARRRKTLDKRLKR